ncbi:hypothetical protein B0H17DRAFT_1147729 [Mycena rosella]|uniref:Uncharacterized protein n=1 Tax=Mycena rosella TaxID=1033263 RepID=A0AAD7CHY9_MYCRO|nr:hypothetical protein B0H17DRAFT_1147729 [Mycena rosella]
MEIRSRNWHIPDSDARMSGLYVCWEQLNIESRDFVTLTHLPSRQFPDHLISQIWVKSSLSGVSATPDLRSGAAGFCQTPLKVGCGGSGPVKLPQRVVLFRTKFCQTESCAKVAARWSDTRSSCCGPPHGVSDLEDLRPVEVLDWLATRQGVVLLSRSTNLRRENQTALSKRPPAGAFRLQAEIYGTPDDISSCCFRKSVWMLTLGGESRPPLRDESPTVTYRMPGHPERYPQLLKETVGQSCTKAN